MRLFVIALFFTSINSYSQDSLKFKRKEWANIGLGITNSGLINSFKGLSVGLDYNRIFKNKNYLCYQVGASHSSDFWNSPKVNVINSGIGLAFFEDNVLAAAIAGPAVMWGNKWDEKMLVSKSFTSIGINLNIQFAIKPLRDLGVGIEFFSNANVYQSAIGFRIVLQLSSKRE